MTAVFSMEIEGAKELGAALSKMGKMAEDEVSKAVNEVGLGLQGDIKKRYNKGPATGTTYFRIPGENYMTVRAGGQDGTPVGFIPGGGAHNLSLFHRASRAGEAPMTDTGRLAAQTLFKRQGKMSVTVFNTVGYAAWLEFGTRKIAPRPAWVPAVEAMKPIFKRKIEDALRKATK